MITAILLVLIIVMGIWLNIKISKKSPEEIAAAKAATEEFFMQAKLLREKIKARILGKNCN